jgi:glutathione S-transferase
VSFKTCPWVQRSAIVLREKGTPFEFRHIEPDNRPDWFLAISPHKKVPVLRVDDTVSLFESNAINEYLDETIAPRLHPRSGARSTAPDRLCADACRMSLARPRRRRGGPGMRREDCGAFERSKALAPGREAMVQRREYSLVDAGLRAAPALFLLDRIRLPPDRQLPAEGLGGGATAAVDAFVPAA